MHDNDITVIVGWPNEPQMEKFRKVAAAAEAAEREACKERIKAMYEAKNRDPEHGVTCGYSPTLRDYLDAL